MSELTDIAAVLATVFEEAHAAADRTAEAGRALVQALPGDDAVRGRAGGSGRLGQAQGARVRDGAVLGVQAGGVKR